MIIVESKRKKPATILKKYPDAILADVTSGEFNHASKDEVMQKGQWHSTTGLTAQDQYKAALDYFRIKYDNKEDEVWQMV